MTGDGYKVVPNQRPFSRKPLSGYDLLVIVNAPGPAQHRDSSPFTEEECTAVRDRVSAGGALLLITDHAPFSAAVAKLSKRFELSITNGYTMETSHYNKESGEQTELVFTREDGLVGEHPITRGRDLTERINRIITFSGTSLKAPAGSVAFLKLADTAVDVLPPDRKPTPDEPSPDHKTVSAAGRAQGVALKVGKGRVVVLGEAAMLTAQVAPRGLRFGMNIAGIDNRQMALNIMHYALAFRFTQMSGPVPDSNVAGNCRLAQRRTLNGNRIRTATKRNLDAETQSSYSGTSADENSNSLGSAVTLERSAWQMLARDNDSSI